MYLGGGLTGAAEFARLEVHGCQTLDFARDRVKCRNGGIGRRAWFRSMYSQGCGGSSPLFGTSRFAPSKLFLSNRLVLLSEGQSGFASVAFRMGSSGLWRGLSRFCASLDELPPRAANCVGELSKEDGRRARPRPTGAGGSRAGSGRRRGRRCRTRRCECRPAERLSGRDRREPGRRSRAR